MMPATMLSQSRFAQGPRTSLSLQSSNKKTVADGKRTPASACTPVVMTPSGAPGMITTPLLDAELSVRPELGLLVLFPSYFWHGTLPFHSEQPRLTVAFDVVPETAK
jgi:hypothetical protein